MKLLATVLYCYSIFLFIVSCFSMNVTNAQAQKNAFIVSPERGHLVENRKDFPVVTQLREFDPSAHYWVAIATVSEQNQQDWDRAIQLSRELRTAKDTSKQKELSKLIGQWEIDLFWPRFFVPESPYEGRIFDGGVNPLHGLEPQPMILLFLNVDDALHNYFRNWFRAGAAGKGYRGILGSKLTEEMILTRTEIFFP